LVIVSSWSAYSQSDSTQIKKESGVSLGVEVDVLPYISKGWYASGWVGLDKYHIRIRPVFAKVNVPSFLYDEEFDRNTLQVYALIVDYFFKPDYKGFWVAPGIEYWNGEVEDNFNNTSTYDELVFTVGGGYVWKFPKNFYLNPWVAFHLHMAGDRDVSVGEEVYRTSIFTPEASLKLGWYIPLEKRAGKKDSSFY